MKNSYFIIIGLLTLLSIIKLKAQSVENVVASFDGENITITYDLNHPNSEQLFSISTFSSHNNYQTALALVRGDVGKNISVGVGNEIVWSVKNELPPYFNDEISFKIKAKYVAVADFKITPLANNGFKRGSNLELKWQGGSANDQIKIDLLKNSIVQQSIIETQNSNSYQWEIPKKQKPGSTYALRVSSTTNPNQKASTDFFKIKPKIPIYLKIGVPIILGVVVGVLVGGKDGGGESPTINPEINDLPAPIKPGG